MKPSITCETLKEPCQSLFRQLQQSVDSQLASRLKANRVVQPHGTNRNVLLWRVWDARLPKLGYDQRYACICLNYDPTHFYNRKTTWQLHLYFNTHRVYRHAADVRKLMEKQLPQICPKEFEVIFDDRTAELCWRFNHTGTVDQLVTPVLPKLLAIVNALAPVFDELVQLVSRPATEEERAKVVASRPHPSSKSATVVSWEGGAVFNRSISASLRTQVLAKYGQKCALCRQPLGNNIHIDHILPWSKGGLTELKNLQPTHSTCNLAKGNRH